MFYSRLQRFDAHIGKASDLSVTMLAHNYNEHGTLNTIKDLGNVKVFIMPPYTTSTVQLMDAGVVASIKVRYCTGHIERATDLIVKNVLDFYTIGILYNKYTLKRAKTEIFVILIKP